MSLSGQVVIVTGASRGIGRAIAGAFAEQGARVACVATTQEGANQAASEIGPLAKGYACDVSQASEVEALIPRIEADLGTPAVLVNNAGIARDTLMLRMKEEDWQAVLDVNLKGAFLMIRACLKPMLKARYGRIVNVSSVVGLHGQTGQANYAASKAGLIGLTKAVAKEVGSRGITCNALAPGFIETDMTSKLSEEFQNHVKQNSCAGRLGVPEDLVGPVLFLSSPESGYVTGQVLVVDGGLFV